MTWFVIEEHWVRASFWHFLICLDWLKKYCKGAQKRKYEKEKIRKVKYHPSSKCYLNTQFCHIKKDFDSSMNRAFVTHRNLKWSKKEIRQLDRILLMYIMQKPIPISHQELFMGLRLSFFTILSRFLYYLFLV